MDFFEFIKKNKLIILIISIISNLLLSVGVITTLWLYNTYECECSKKINVEEIAHLDEEKEEISTYFVEIKGEVKKPGVYKVTKDSIVNDVVKLAGGFLKTAYTNNINLSRKVSKELVIYVFSKTEYKKINKSEENKQQQCICPTIEITECVNEGISEIIAPEEYASENNVPEKENNIVEPEISVPDKDIVVVPMNPPVEVVKPDDKSNNESEEKISVININKASKEDLLTLTGIGDSKATAIIEYRTNNGLFKNIEEIKNVSGIGDSVFEKIKANITV